MRPCRRLARLLPLWVRTPRPRSDRTSGIVLVQELTSIQVHHCPHVGHRRILFCSSRQGSRGMGSSRPPSTHSCICCAQRDRKLPLEVDPGLGSGLWSECGGRLRSRIHRVQCLPGKWPTPSCFLTYDAQSPNAMLAYEAAGKLLAGLADGSVWI